MREDYINYYDYLNLKNDKVLFLKSKIRKHNKLFINNKVQNECLINNLSLDNEQKEAIYTNEINTLVLAGAGSGKTLTIMGKINYLVEEKNINPKEILCISFTNETVNNLKNKTKYDIDIFTFHKLSLEIIKDYHKNYSIISSDYLNYIINEIFYSICKNIDEKILNYFNREISSFINLFKLNNLDINYLDKLIKKDNDKLLLLIKKIYLIYNEELLSTNSIDFNDMIITSINLIKEKGFKRYYKYIIIDEFQDISYSKYELIKEIQSSCNSFLFAVGDDYQSIYKFAGSKIDMITKFNKYFKHNKILRINHTYRNSIELIKVASNFVMKNKNQIKKNLVSDMSLYKPIKIVYYSKNINIKIKKILDNKKFLILGRNTFDVFSLLDDEVTLDKDIIHYKNNEYKYMTVHKSKGLEEDNVLIINLSDNYMGFPSKKESKYSNILLKKDKYLYEEERRLFYVALTRTKGYCYLLVDKDNPSVFIKEILMKNKKYIEVLNL